MILQYFAAVQPDFTKPKRMNHDELSHVLLPLGLDTSRSASSEVVLLTPGVFERPWCLVEFVTASWLQERAVTTTEPNIWAKTHILSELNSGL